jgi:dTDP-4-dehydrorhamnose 3,5-epimerase/CDP-3, 6-dideoxy-D-glycero-D-glycero-4-hexulose-5-epimerase
MKILPNGVVYWKTSSQLDNRGDFKKILSKSQIELFPNFKISDYFVSNSSINVIRGMHLQVGEFASNRIIYVQSGKILDVLVDLNNSATPPAIVSEVLGPLESFDALYVPAGVAHGYEALDESSVIYLSDKDYSPLHDKGFSYKSFDFNWHSNNPILSERDSNLPNFSEFKF